MSVGIVNDVAEMRREMMAMKEELAATKKELAETKEELAKQGKVVAWTGFTGDESQSLKKQVRMLEWHKDGIYSQLDRIQATLFPKEYEEVHPSQNGEEYERY